MQIGYRKLIGLMLLICSCPYLVNAQVGCFLIQPDSVGCVPLKVDIDNCYTPGQPVAYNFSLAQFPNAWFQANVNNGGDTSYTYPDAGKYVLGQGISGQFRNAFRRNIRVFQNGSKPQYTLSGCDEQLVVVLKDSLFTRIRFTVDGQTYVINRSRSDTLLRFPISVAGVFKKMEVRATGLYPNNCGNTERVDSAVVYANNSFIPPVHLVYDLTSNLPELKVAFPQRANNVFFIKYNCPIAQISFRTKNMPSTAISVDTNLILPCTNGILSIRQNGFCPNLLKDSLELFSPTVSQRSDSIDIRSLRGGPFTSLFLDFKLLGVRNAPYLVSATVPSGCNRQVEIRTIDTLETRFRLTNILNFKPDKSVLKASLFSITWNNDSPIFIYLLNSTAKSDSSLIACYKSTSFGDTLKVAGVDCSDPPYCHSTQVNDSCGNQITVEDCPVYVTTTADSECLTVNWNTAKLNRKGCRLLEVRNGKTDTVFIANLQSGKYQLCGIDTLREPVSYCIECDRTDSLPLIKSNISEFINKFAIVLPNAFTPNGDGVNDSLSIKKVGYLLTVSIYNSWGEGVFTSSLVDKVVWPGTFRSALAPAGNYMLKLEVKREKEVIYIGRQVVTLIR